MTTPAPAPSAPGRKARTEEERRALLEKERQRAAAIEKQKELWAALNRFISKNGGWLTSSPGERPLRIETLVHSELPEKLYDLGYDLYPTDGISGERIEGGKILPTLRFQFQIPTPR